MDCQQAREHLCSLARLAYDRRLLDSAGGNFSLRLDDQVFCTPRFAGSKRQWQLLPEDVLLVDLDGNLLEGPGELSREIRMHLGIYRAFPEAGGVCHAHAFHVMPFAYLRRPIRPASEQTEKYGTIELTEAQPAHSQELAHTVVETLSRKQHLLQKHAIACLIPHHGITVAGRDLDDAYDALERIDQSCATLIAAAAISSNHSIQSPVS
jgi:L-fuculose-phosphate aldolase